jgi:Sigma-70, region 4
MRRIIKSSSKVETGWDQALALYREQLKVYLDYLIPCGCSEDILARVEGEVRDSVVSDGFKLRYLVRTLVRNVIRHMRESDHTTENSRFLSSDLPNAVLALPSQERMVYFLRDILEYSKRDTSLLIGITDAQADKLLSLARKRIDMTEEPSSMEIQSPHCTYFRWKFTDIHLR